MARIDRRGFVSCLGAAASPFVLPRALARAQGGEADPFPLGVAAGEPWPDGFVIWTRLAPQPLAPDGQGGLSAPVSVRWEVARDEAFTSVAARGQVEARLAEAHSLHVEVTDLAPGRPYWYRFTALGVQSPVGRARTAPASGSRVPLRLAIASCAHYEVGWYAAYRHMAAENPDLVLFLGDYIYEYTYPAGRADVVRRHDRPTEANDLAGYRNRYALYKSDPDLKALHQAAACLVTWDDHEVQNDYAGVSSQFATVSDEAFAARRRAAYQAFYEHMPLRSRARPTASGLRLHDRYRFGDLAQISVLDGRQHRSRQACPVGASRRGHVAPLTCPDFADPSRTLLGSAQEAWLYDGFRRAGARWNLIAQQQLFSSYLQRTADGSVGQFTDGWSAHGQARDRLIAAMTGSKLANPVLFGGDIHAFVAAEVKVDFANPASPTVASEFVGASITSDGIADSFAATLPMNPHVKFVDNDPRGYMSVSLFPDRMETRFRAISDRRDPKARVSTLKSFAVMAGSPGVVVT